jgi:hypothetical protein
VFNSSMEEGVSELDTLFRINELFFKKIAQNMVLRKTSLLKLADKIRGVSQNCKDDKLLPKLSTWKIQRQELYNEDINSLYLPIELGDIFEKTDTTNKRKFVLLGQPCDLMVRNEGQRDSHVVEGILVEIVPTLPPNSRGYELPYFDKDTGGKSFVSFRNTYNIKLWVLDLSVFQKDGQSQLFTDRECPQLVIPSWKLYYKKICSDGIKMLEQYKELTAVTEKASLQKLVLFSSYEPPIFNGSLYPGRKCISFKCKRIMRLTQQRANAVLSEFMQYCARSAYDRDFGKVS